MACAAVGAAEVISIITSALSDRIRRTASPITVTPSVCVCVRFPYDGITLVSPLSVFGRAGGIPPARSLFFVAIFHLRRASQVSINSPTEKDPEPGTGAGSIATEEGGRRRTTRLGQSRFVERAENQPGRTVSPSAVVIRTGVHRKDQALGDANPPR